MADEYIPMEFYTDDTLAVELGEVNTIHVQANYNQTDPTQKDYIKGRENIATKDDLTETMFFTEWDIRPDTPTDVTELVTYKPSFSEAQDHFGGGSSADSVPHMRAVWRQGIPSSSTEEILPLITCVGSWAYEGSFTLYFANKDYKLTLTYQYDTSVSPYGDLLSVTALLTEESSIGDILTLETTSLEHETVIAGPSREVLAEYAKSKTVRLIHKLSDYDVDRIYILSTTVESAEDQTLALHFTYFDAYNSEYWYAMLTVSDNDGIVVDDCHGPFGIASFEDVEGAIDNKIGDIETALDGIIAIQESYIGGGNV